MSPLAGATTKLQDSVSAAASERAQHLNELEQARAELAATAETLAQSRSEGAQLRGEERAIQLCSIDQLHSLSQVPDARGGETCGVLGWPPQKELNTRVQYHLTVSILHIATDTQL